MSPNVCLVLMSPAPLTIVTAPSFTSHLASPSLADDHLLRSFPSNRTMASEGASAQEAPGVTFLGLGVQISVTVGSLVSGVCADKDAAMSSSGMTRKHIRMA